MSVYNTVINFYHLWDDSIYINNATDDDDNYDHRDDGNECWAECLAHNTRAIDAISESVSSTE